MRSQPLRGLRERAEAGVFLRLDKVQEAKHGIAVKRERARQSLQARIKELSSESFFIEIQTVL